MRRRPGLQGLQRGAQARDKYRELGEQFQEAKAETVKAQMALLKKGLEEFAVKHRKDIRQDPEFRAQFHTMCTNVGVDPLVSNQGMWAQLLGFGDFYYELGVQIIEACLATRAINGGLMDLRALQRYVERRRGSAADPVSIDDIMQAIKKLRVLGGGFRVMKVGQQRLLASVSKELNTDKNCVLELAQDAGCISADQLRKTTSWIETRVSETLSDLVREGLAMIDDGAPDGVRLYWFPCLEISESASMASSQQN